MSDIDKQQQIAVLERFGINVQTAQSGVNYGEAISENSPSLERSATVIYGLMEKYAALEGLIGRGLRTSGGASNEMVSELQMARKDVQGWKKNNQDDNEVVYASRRLDEVIARALSECGA